MIPARRHLAALALWLLGAGFLGACGPSDPGRFYVLSSPPGLTPVAARPELALGVGPVTLPPHLDRTQIVTLASRHRLDLKALDQWGEPLKDGMTRVLAQNLSSLLETEQVFRFPWRRPIAVQYQVVVEVQRFDTDTAGDSVLTARWDLITDEGRTLIRSRTGTFRSQVAGQEVESMVAAMSANLAAMSQDIAQDVATAAKR